MVASLFQRFLERNRRRNCRRPCRRRALPLSLSLSLSLVLPLFEQKEGKNGWKEKSVRLKLSDKGGGG